MSVLALSLPPLLTSLLAVVIAARTGWFPVGGVAATDQQSASEFLRHLALPAVALALPVAALLERLQHQATRDTLSQPFITAALARGLPRERVLWRHVLVPSLKPVLAVYGTVLGTLLSGSLAVEIVMSWPGLGRLMYEALLARDTYLVAGCAAAASLFLAAGNLLSDVAVVVSDPRLRDTV